MTFDAHVVARSMLTKYGRYRAEEYAYGYAVGMYFEQTAMGRARWLAVLEEIKTIVREEKIKYDR
jgi:hypothetical protein